MKTFQEFLEEAYKLPGQRLAFRTAYHGTSVPNAKNIRKSGFQPGTRYDQDKPLPSGERIYVTTSNEKARNYANQAGPEKYGIELDYSGGNNERRSPIRSRQVTSSRFSPTGEMKTVGLRGKITNFVTRRNQPEILKLAVADRLGDGKKPMTPSKSSQPDERTISRTQANTALKNAQALERMRTGTIKNPKGKKRFSEELVSETSLTRVMSKSEKGGMAIMSAQRGDKSKAENKARSRQLERDIRGAGLPGPTKVSGRYTENPGTSQERKVGETSHIVTPGKMGKRKFKKVIEKLGKKYDQDSVLIQRKPGGGATLKGTSDTSFPGEGKNVKIGSMKPGRTGEFDTRVKNKTFTVED